MKLLSIGNSFSTDAQRWLHGVSVSGGCEIYCANLYIGGCSLERHCQNLASGAADYDYEINGEPAERKISIKEALALCDWDVVTLQQVSGKSGITESFEPYLHTLFEYVRAAVPNARIYLHKTWAYDESSEHPDFAFYANNQQTMYDGICAAYAHYSEKYGVPVIPVGDVIQRIRHNVEPFAGGKSITRDGFHLSLDYGRYAAALVWYAVLTGRDVKNIEFTPDGADRAVCAAISAEVSGALLS